MLENTLELQHCWFVFLSNGPCIKYVLFDVWKHLISVGSWFAESYFPNVQRCELVQVAMHPIMHIYRSVVPVSVHWHSCMQLFVPRIRELPENFVLCWHVGVATCMSHWGMLRLSSIVWNICVQPHLYPYMQGALQFVLRLNRCGFSAFSVPPFPLHSQNGYPVDVQWGQEPFPRAPGYLWRQRDLWEVPGILLQERCVNTRRPCS